MKLNGIYSRNKYFDSFYMIGAQELPYLEEDVYVDHVVSSTIFESYEDYLAQGWADFIRDFCE